METPDSGRPIPPPPPPPFAAPTSSPPAAPPGAPAAAPTPGPARVRTVTVPTARASLRACLPLLKAYGITLAAALVVMVLLVAGIAVAEGGGGDADPSDEVDIKAIGTLVGIPFQLVAMALGGSLGFGDTDFAVGLYAPPLALTAVFLVAVHRFSRRAEAAAPSGSTAERAILAGAGALGLAITALVLTRALAMRDDDVAAHAAGLGLFLGVVAVGGTTAFLGRQSATTSLWPRWLPADGRRALHLLTQHVVVGTVLLIPVGAVWMWIEDDFGTALLALVWGVTIGLTAFGLGHLGGVSFGGDTSLAWDLGWFAGVVLPLVALALALLAALAWHLRRGPDRALLQHPGSWASLPAAYGGGALALCLVSTMGVHGEVFGVDGGLWLHLAYWLVPVLALWGAVIEVLSRFVAPALAGALPGGLARRLGAGPARLASAPAAPVEWGPMTPEDQQRAKKALIGSGVVLGIVLVAGIAFSIAESALSDPEGRAEAYLDALVDGDAEKAVELAPVDGDDAATDLLTNDVYGDAEDRITGYEITDVDDGFGDTVTVTVDLEGIEGGDDVELTLEKDGKRAVLFDDWKVSDGGLASTVSVSLPDGSESLTANGVSVDTGDGEDYWALPGSYTFNPFEDSEWLDTTESETVVAPGEYYTYAEFESPEPSDELKNHVDTVVADHLAKCMESTEFEPDGCPQDTYAYGDRQRKVVWTLTTAPVLSWDSFYDGFPVTVYSETPAEATVTYEYAYEYPGEPLGDWTKESEEANLYLSVNVDLVDDEPVVTFDTD